MLLQNGGSSASWPYELLCSFRWECSCRVSELRRCTTCLSFGLWVLSVIAVSESEAHLILVSFSLGLQITQCRSHVYTRFKPQSGYVYTWRARVLSSDEEISFETAEPHHQRTKSRSQYFDVLGSWRKARQTAVPWVGLRSLHVS